MITVQTEHPTGLPAQTRGPVQHQRVGSSGLFMLKTRVQDGRLCREKNTVLQTSLGARGGKMLPR